MENIKIACALTGHRKTAEDFSVKKLKETFLFLIEQKDVCIFYCGMAIGFDLIACNLLCDLREKFPQIKIIACIPCPEQNAKFDKENKRLYEQTLLKCDRQVVISPVYDRACMHIRNRYMVDRANFLVAHCNRESGGTASTVRYAKKKNREIIFV